MLDSFHYDPYSDRPAELRRLAERRRVTMAGLAAAPGRRSRFRFPLRRR